MTDLLDETIDDLKEERKKNLLLSYMKPAAYIVIVMLVIGVAKVGWDSYRNDALYHDGGEFLAAKLKFMSGDSEGGAQKLEAIANNNTSYGALAALNYASYSAFQNDVQKAIHYYQQVASNSKLDNQLREYAEFMALNMQVISGDLNQDSAVEALTKYTESKPAYTASARELLASILIDLKRYQEAEKVLQESLADESLMTALQQRAKSLLVLCNQ